MTSSVHLTESDELTFDVTADVPQPVMRVGVHDVFLANGTWKVIPDEDLRSLRAARTLLNWVNSRAVKSAKKRMEAYIETVEQ
jgi:hypothetical protein